MIELSQVINASPFKIYQHFVPLQLQMLNYCYVEACAPNLVSWASKTDWTNIPSYQNKKGKEPNLNETVSLVFIHQRQNSTFDFFSSIFPRFLWNQSDRRDRALPAKAIGQRWSGTVGLVRIGIWSVRTGRVSMWGGTYRRVVGSRKG